jgi:hypothetical protein
VAAPMPVLAPVMRRVRESAIGALYQSGEQCPGSDLLWYS